MQVGISIWYPSELVDSSGPGAGFAYLVDTMGNRVVDVLNNPIVVRV